MTSFKYAVDSTLHREPCTLLYYQIGADQKGVGDSSRLTALRMTYGALNLPQAPNLQEVEPITMKQIYGCPFARE